MKYFTAPNAAMAALVAIITDWLVQFFPEWWLTGLIVAGGAAVVKFVEIWAKGGFAPQPKPVELDPGTMQPMSAPGPQGTVSAYEEKPRNVLARVLFG